MYLPSSTLSRSLPMYVETSTMWRERRTRAWRREGWCVADPGPRSSDAQLAARRMRRTEGLVCRRTARASSSSWLRGGRDGRSGRGAPGVGGRDGGEDDGGGAAGRRRRMRLSGSDGGCGGVAGRDAAGRARRECLWWHCRRRAVAEREARFGGSEQLIRFVRTYTLTMTELVLPS